MDFFCCCTCGVALVEEEDDGAGAFCSGGDGDCNKSEDEGMDRVDSVGGVGDVGDGLED